MWSTPLAHRIAAGTPQWDQPPRRSRMQAQQNDKYFKIDDLSFVCKTCQAPKPRCHLCNPVSNQSKDPEYYDALNDTIISAGNTRTCGKDKEDEEKEEIQWSVCNHVLLRGSYSDSRWKNRHLQKTSCQHCETEQKTKKLETFPRSVCEQILSEASFSISQWHTRLKRGATCEFRFQSKCTNSECLSCLRCYSTQCKIKTNQCPKDFDGKLRTQSMLPRSAEELATWLCPTCVYTCCQVCRKEPKYHPVYHLRHHLFHISIDFGSVFPEYHDFPGFPSIPQIFQCPVLLDIMILWISGAPRFPEISKVPLFLVTRTGLI